MYRQYSRCRSIRIQVTGIRFRERNMKIPFLYSIPFWDLLCSLNCTFGFLFHRLTGQIHENSFPYHASRGRTACIIRATCGPCV